MLKKLLKYDLKNMFKFLSIFYILAIFFGLTTRIFFEFDNTTIMHILGQISMGCMFAMIANILINNMMRNWIRFKETLYGDESYLTHTLPITKNTLYTSKFILSLISLLVSFLVVVLVLFITFYSKDTLDLITNLVKPIAEVCNVSIFIIIISLIILLYLELYSAIQSGFIGIILGHKKSNNKVLFSTIYGFIIYMISQFIITISIFVTGLFNNNVMKIFTSNTMDYGILKILIIVSTLVYILIIILMKLFAQKELNRGVNVE